MADVVTVRKSLERIFHFLEGYTGEEYEQLREELNQRLKGREPSSPEIQAQWEKLNKKAETIKKLSELLGLNLQQLEELGLLGIVLIEETFDSPTDVPITSLGEKFKGKLLHKQGRPMSNETLQILKVVVSSPGISIEEIERTVFGTDGDEAKQEKIMRVKYSFVAKITKTAEVMGREINEVVMSEIVSSWLPASTKEQTRFYQQMKTDFGGMLAVEFVRRYFSFRKVVVVSEVSAHPVTVVLDSVVETLLGYKFCQAGSSDFLVPIVGQDIGDFLRTNGIGKARIWKDTLLASFHRAQKVNGESVSEKDCRRAQENIIAALKNGGTVFSTDEKNLNTRFFLAVLRQADPDQKKRLADFIFPTGKVNVDLCSGMVLTPAELGEGAK